MILGKRDGLWRIAQATETRIAASSIYDQLEQLDWLIGDWKTTTANGTASLKAEWSPGKSFIWINCVSIDKDGSSQKVDKQVIGWDERAGSIVSWFFGHRGNFSYGKWRHSGSDWEVDNAGIVSDGTDTKSTDVYSPRSASQFHWKSVGRSAAGNVVADSDALIVERVKGGTK